MTQIERAFTVTYRWWRSNKKAIKKAHVEALEETAMSQIRRMMAQGFLEGELSDNIHMVASDPPDGIEYCGRWWIRNHDVDLNGKLK